VVHEGYCRYEAKFADESTGAFFGHYQSIGELKPGEFKTIPLRPAPSADPWRISLAFFKGAPTQIVGGKQSRFPTSIKLIVTTSTVTVG
jgi:hypothetical protein